MRRRGRQPVSRTSFSLHQQFLTLMPTASRFRAAGRHDDLTGPWIGGGSNVDIELEGGLKPGELPLLPWASDLRARRNKADEPYTACLPMGVPRVNPYPWKFAMSYSAKAGAYLRAARDGRCRCASRHLHGRPPASERPIPTWWGLTGRWENDTLVIDTVGYNDKFWFDSRGTPIRSSCTPWNDAHQLGTTATSSCSTTLGRLRDR